MVEITKGELSLDLNENDKSAVCLTRRAENGICNKEFDS